MTTETPDTNKTAQISLFAVLVLIILTAVGSWQAAQFVSDNNRMRTENIELKAKNTELARELEKCSLRTGFRPGSPIGSSPAGSAPTGAAPTPIGE